MQAPPTTFVQVMLSVSYTRVTAPYLSAAGGALVREITVVFYIYYFLALTSILETLENHPQHNRLYMKIATVDERNAKLLTTHPY